MTATFSPLRLPVRTASGQKLGTVVDVEIDPDTQSVRNYLVKGSRMVPDVVQSPLIISSRQVIEINSHDMVVDDSILKQSEGQPAALAT